MRESTAQGSAAQGSAVRRTGIRGASATESADGGRAIRGHALIGFVLAVIAVALAACTPQARSPDGPRAGLERIPGVVAVDLGSRRTQNGLDPTRIVVDAVLELDDVHEVGADDATVLDFLLRLAWCLDDERPTSALYLGIDVAASGLPAGFDAERGAVALGIESIASRIGLETGLSREVLEVRLGDDDPMAAQQLLDLLGPWPGAVPEPPPGLIVARPSPT